MELQFYFYVAYFFIGIFLIYLIYVLSRLNYKAIWQDAKLQFASKEEVAKAIAKGQKPFHFENGKVTIYAKSQLGAMLKYNKLKPRKTYANWVKFLKKV